MVILKFLERKLCLKFYAENTKMKEIQIPSVIPLVSTTRISPFSASMFLARKLTIRQLYKVNILLTFSISRKGNRNIMHFQSAKAVYYLLQNTAQNPAENRALTVFFYGTQNYGTKRNSRKPPPKTFRTLGWKRL